MAQAITSELERQERPIAWLARKADIPYPTITRRLSGYADFKISEVYRIAESLGMEPQRLVELAFEDFADHKQAA